MATYQVPVWFNIEARDQEVAWMYVCEALAAADRHDTDLSGTMEWVVEEPTLIQDDRYLAEPESIDEEVWWTEDEADYHETWRDEQDDV